MQREDERWKEEVDAMREICQLNGVDPLILIPIFVHDFLCIHPFRDGNGRMSRLLTTLLLYRSGYFVGKYISLEAKIAKIKDLYYDALSDSQNGAAWRVLSGFPKHSAINFMTLHLSMNDYIFHSLFSAAAVF